ncbi:MAG: AsmA-like C-terminal region-containing protein [Verrucomicrobiales bacterium]
MRILRKLVLFAILFLLLTAGWAAIYAYDKGFTKKWRGLVRKEFEKHGIEATIGRLTLDPFQGLVARDVHFYQDETRKSLLAAVSRITLDIDLIRLLEKEFFLNTIDIRDANLSLPVDPENSESDHLLIQDFSARILMDGDRIEISQAHGELHGVHFVVRGSLFKPSPEASASNGGEHSGEPTALSAIQERRHLLDLVVREMEKLEFSKKDPPQVRIDISGDLDDPESLHGTARIEANSLARGSYEVEELKALFELRHSKLSLKELFIRDAAGELQAQGDYLMGADRASIKLQSTIDIHGLANSFYDSPSLGEIVFYDAPRITLEGDLLIGKKAPEGHEGFFLPADLIGSVHCGTFASRGAIFDGIEAEFGIEPERWYLRNVKLSHQSGSFTANGLFDRDGLRYTAVVRMDPTVFAPFCRREATRKLLERCHFTRDSDIYIRIHGTGPGMQIPTWHSFAEADLRNFDFNGIPVVRVTGEIELDKSQKYYRNLRLMRAEGSAEASFVSFNSDTRVVVIEDCSGTVFPERTVRYFSQGIGDVLKPYRFEHPPQVSVSGTIDLKDRSGTDFKAEIVTTGGVKYDLLGQTLPLDGGSANLHYRGDNLNAARFESSLFGGEASTELAITGLSGERNYTSKVELKSVDLLELARLYGYDGEAEGELSGYFDFTGQGKEFTSIDGSGVGIIVNGDVFSIPLLGPLAKLIGGVLPNTSGSYSIAREASANFTIKEGIISTDDFEALTSAFRLSGGGSINCINQAVKFDARMNARGAPGLLLLPVSKLLEYRAEGTISDPQWRPRILPEVLSRGGFRASPRKPGAAANRAKP